MTSTSTSSTGNRGEVVATMRAQDGAGVVRTESRFATSAEDLWEALTTPERLARWIGEVSGDLRVGGTFAARFTSSWTGSGVVEVCEPPRRLVTRMGEQEDGETVMEATLEEQGDGVLLVIEERGLPLTNLAAYGAGWQVHVEDLGRHLAGGERGDWFARWQELVPAYRDQPVG
jgi:uncharacterized protein YndB with AHSA1/START domain